MHRLSEKFLTRPEQGKITATVQEAERRTSGEIVPMVVSASHDYPAATIAATLSFALPSGLFISGIISKNLWMGTSNTWIFITLTAIIYLILYPLISRTKILKALFLNPNTVETEVRNSALAAFYSEKLYKTKNENGILIYISVLEKKVWFLADANINSKIKQQEWDSIVDELTKGIKCGEQAAAICKAITQTGEILQHHFPLEENDKNELHNLIIR